MLCYVVSEGSFLSCGGDASGLSLRLCCRLSLLSWARELWVLPPLRLSYVWLSRRLCTAPSRRRLLCETAALLRSFHRSEPGVRMRCVMPSGSVLCGLSRRAAEWLSSVLPVLWRSYLSRRLRMPPSISLRRKAPMPRILSLCISYPLRSIFRASEGIKQEGTASGSLLFSRFTSKKLSILEC